MGSASVMIQSKSFRVIWRRFRLIWRRFRLTRGRFRLIRGRLKLRTEHLKLRTEHLRIKSVVCRPNRMIYLREREKKSEQRYEQTLTEDTEQIFMQRVAHAKNAGRSF